MSSTIRAQYKKKLYMYIYFSNQSDHSIKIEKIVTTFSARKQHAH